MLVDVRTSTAVVAWTRYSELGEPERTQCLDLAAELTNTIYAGLDLR
jgi:hypothetical protein